MIACPALRGPEEGHIRNFQMKMPLWRNQALKTFPELASRFEHAETAYQLWFELLDAFKEAYECNPRNESLIRKIYRYSDWCETQPRGQTADDDLLTCVCVCFYEKIPTFPPSRADMPRWWRPTDLDGDRNVFQYRLSDQEFANLKQFLRREQHRFDPSLRTPKL